jgi:membrane-associated phospholipid phosphatase
VTGRPGPVGGVEVAPRVPVLPLTATLFFGGSLVVFAVAGLYGPFLKALVAGLFLAALATRRLASFVRDWAVFLAGLALFDSLRAVVFTAVNSLGLPLYMGYVIRLERTLFGGEPLPTLLQPWLLSPGAPGPLQWLLVAVHGSHFVVFLLFGLYLWLVRRAVFGRFAAAMLLLMLLGIAGYLAVPTVPPWMAADFQAIPPLHRVVDDVYSRAGSLRRAFDTNPVAAMPSLHAAFAALCAFVGVRHFGAWGWPLGGYLGLMGVAAVALGEHYLLDIVAGVLLAAAVYWLAYRSGLRAGFEPRSQRRANPRGPRASRGEPETARRLALAAVLLLLAAGVGQAALRFRRPFAVTESFVSRELSGRPVSGPPCRRC